MNIQTILEFVAALAILIILHELGHFLMSRLMKIEVEEFGLGYPPRMLTLFTAGGTRFSLNWLPFGGFCRMKGENDPDVPGGFSSANPWKRIAVLIAGPAMNLLTAVILYTVIVNLMGMPQLDQVEIKSVAPGSPAALAGLQEGDIIQKVDETLINSTDKLSLTIADAVGKEISLVLKRGEETVTVYLVPRVDPPEGEGAMGIVMGNPILRVGVVNALPAGVTATYQHGKALLGFVGQVISGNTAAEEGRLVGFKGMYDMYSQTRDSEPVAGVPTVVNALAFFTSISISLGLLNLLPIPALDGGRILFTLPEIILHRRIPPKYENVINLVSFGLLLLLMVFINIQDFINPVSLP
jgi:regulator of sigma E protease